MVVAEGSPDFVDVLAATWRGERGKESFPVIAGDELRRRQRWRESSGIGGVKAAAAIGLSK